MESTATIIAEQISWATAKGLCPDAVGYLPDWKANLAYPLSDAARVAFEGAPGSELIGSTESPPKMAALHSSAALAVNFFDYWTTRSAAPLAVALGLDETPLALAFESQFSTGLRGTPPTLDVAFQCPSGRVIGVESKFTEWLAPKSHGGDNFKTSYFPANEGLWEAIGLQGAQSLVNAIRAADVRFVYLDVAQLLKHMLGLATQHQGAAMLFYVFYDCQTDPESELHRAEIESFDKWIGNDLPFRWATYQDVFARMAPLLGPAHGSYVHYLRRRYFNH